VTATGSKPLDLGTWTTVHRVLVVRPGTGRISRETYADSGRVRH